MRVIAGKAKGARLTVPKGLDVRPTLDRVRESLFSILAPRIEGARFLDLFAGTGANGIEALSRGAKACTFVDSDARACETIRRNLEKTHLSQLAEVCLLTLPDAIPRLAERRTQYEVVFADPPYNFTQYGALFRAIERSRLLAPNGIVVVEHAARTEMLEIIEDFKRTRRADYGDTALSFFS